MRKARLILSGLLVGAALAAVTVAAPRASGADGHGVHYYVALGDSLSVGWQPTGNSDGTFLGGETDQGYADQLYTALAAADPRLKLVKLGCGGESTVSMRLGGLPPDVGFSCGSPDFYRHRYPHKTQLGEAVSFLHAHRGFVSRVTIDIGGNDLAFAGVAGLDTIRQNLPVILAQLRQATGPGVPIVAMNLYDPFLAPTWFASHDLAALQAEASLNVGLNDFVEGIYAAAGVPVADVEAAFSTTDLTLEASGLPRDVARICQWTWMCVPPPLGPDVHANAAGYGVIARALEAVLPMEVER